MTEQGAGGGIDPFLQGRGRSKSDNERGPAETAVPARSPPQDDQGAYSPNGLPRGVMETGQSRSDGGDVLMVVSEPDPTLLRKPSSRSTRSARSTRSRTRSRSPHRRRLDPPVTKTTLSELDVTKIIHNPKLRHDINYDPELHFRPNTDGEKGRRKHEKATEFWTALQDQLYLFAQDPDGFLRQHGQGEDWCLPTLLRSVKDIIQTLVPTKDRDVVEEGLNVELLMQQFIKGTVDLEKLAAWLARMLKQHCAPMRDEWIDNIYNNLSLGARHNDMPRLVLGMRSLLEVLEAMKLDVANHQIRCLRPVLIEDTVHFEQRFFHKKIQSRKMDIESARKWFRQVREEVLNTVRRHPALPPSEMDVFFAGLAGLLRPSNEVAFAMNDGPSRPGESAGRVPCTFLFDEERLLKLRSDMLDAVNLEICTRVFEERQYPTLSGRSSGLPAYVADDESSARSSDHFDFNNTPLSSRPSSFDGSCDSPMSSPWNSGGLFGSQHVDFADVRNKSRDLYNSLLALLHTAPQAARPSQRWREMIPAAAVQIFRFLNAPPSVLPEIEQRLQKAFRFDSIMYREVERHFSRRLDTELAARVREFRSLSGIGLFSIATGARVPPVSGQPRSSTGPSERGPSSSPAADAREEAGVGDMATRLAHLGILHWRVWAQLAYADPDTDMELDSPLDECP